ncbi:M23 family metallopeptidase [Lysinibacillus sp. KU-BSD001]|uniref:M23 family metallopeptidase n=1 Tax=Lysinibacillus sp. KU-BSD001 TaxID=3141328 RepID=UPI0036EAB512
MKAWQWLTSLALCIVIYIGLNSSNESVRQFITSVVYSTEHMTVMRNTVNELFSDDEVVEVASTNQKVLVKFVAIKRYDQGFKLSYEDPITITATQSGVMVYTGHTARTGKVISISYDDGYTVTYGFIDDFYHLPYSTVAQGEVIAMKEQGELFIQIEKNGRVLSLEETVEWIKDHG